MDFTEKITQFSQRVEKIKNTLTTEEATKTSLVLPFFHLLGYDVFNPLEFVPEYTADTGTKKGEKVDYAIMQNNDPIIIIEVKTVNTELNAKHLNQLFRYFTVTKARFGILTNGIVYRFFSDLEEANKMDLMPFLEIDLLNLKSHSIIELAKFKKETFNMKGILNSASELKYTSLLKNAIAEQFNEPSEQFVRALIKNIYTGVKTQAVIDKFKALTRVAIDDYISDLLNNKLKNIISSDVPPETTKKPNASEKEYDFLIEETAALEYIKNMLNICDVSYKKTSRYAYMHISDSQYKWICRISIRQENRLFILHKFNDTDYETEYLFDEVEQLEQIKDLITDTYQKCKNM
ncbi:type I restriction endonuclease [Lachnospiraceae bacterium 66-29]